MYFPPAHSTPLSHCPPRADILGNSHSTALVFSLFLPTSGVFMVYTLHLGISLFCPPLVCWWVRMGMCSACVRVCWRVNLSGCHVLFQSDNILCHDDGWWDRDRERETESEGERVYAISRDAYSDLLSHLLSLTHTHTHTHTFICTHGLN